MAELAAVYAVSRSQIIPRLCWSVKEPTLSWNEQGRSLVWEWDRARVRVIDWYLAKDRPLARARTWTRVLGMDRELDQALAWEQPLAQLLANAAKTHFPAWLKGKESLAALMALTEWYFGSPHTAIGELEDHISILQSMATANDDWTRLAALTGLMLLGRGTPAHCNARNTLLDKGMENPQDFTFPDYLQPETNKPEFVEKLPNLLRHIFLHKPGQPWLKPEWFEATHPAAAFFCAGPRKFFAQAAAVLDPRGETDLAKEKTD